jgi:acyl carrier protein
MILKGFFRLSGPVPPVHHEQAPWEKRRGPSTGVTVARMENVFLCTLFNQQRTDMSDIKSRVIAIIVDKLGVDQGEVTPEASFTNDLGADSLDTVELIMEFEKEFNIAIPDDQAEKIQTVGQAVDYVEKNAK